MTTLKVPTRDRNQMMDVTAKIQEIVRDAGMKIGQVICYVPHTNCRDTLIPAIHHLRRDSVERLCHVERV